MAARPFYVRRRFYRPFAPAFYRTPILWRWPLFYRRPFLWRWPLFAFGRRIARFLTRDVILHN